MGTQASSLKVKITDGQAGGEAARRSGWVSLAPRLERARTCDTGRPCCLRPQTWSPAPILGSRKPSLETLRAAALAHLTSSDLVLLHPPSQFVADR